LAGENRHGGPGRLVLRAWSGFVAVAAAALVFVVFAVAVHVCIDNRPLLHGSCGLSADLPAFQASAADPWEAASLSAFQIYCLCAPGAGPDTIGPATPSLGGGSDSLFADRENAEQLPAFRYLGNRTLSGNR
jgi:hypothetical protein